MSEVELNDQNFEEKIKKTKGVALVDFWAPWCGPCQMMGPVIEKIAESYTNKAVVAKLNVDDNQKTAQEFQVMSIPTLIFFKDGQEVERLVGASDPDTLKEKLDQHLEK